MMRRKRRVLGAALGLCGVAAGIFAWAALRRPDPVVEVDTSGIGTPPYRDVQRLSYAADARDLTDDEIHRVFALASSPDGYTIRARACTILRFVKRAEWRERVVNRLGDALADAERVVVMCACDSLAVLGAREKADQIAALLRHPDAYISTAAERSLAKLLRR